MISTGLLGLDKLLGGGIAAGTITDIFGPAGSGKTQLALQICVNLLDRGNVVYQDTSGGFRPERLLGLVQSRGKNEKLLDKVIVARITNVAEQVNYVNKIAEINPSLVVIDDVTSLFSFEYSKESSTLEKHVRFMEYMRMLSLVAIQMKIPIVITNTVRSSGNEETENLDKSISMFTHRKVQLTKMGQKFIAQVFPFFGLGKQISYEITKNGVVELS